MHKFEITLKELKLLQGLFFRFLICLTVVYLTDFSDWQNVILIVVLTLPTIYLHIKYAIADKGKKLILYNNSIVLETINGEKFDLGSAKKIIVNGSVALNRRVIPILIDRNYYNVIFVIENFGEISLSSLVDTKLLSYIKERVDNEKIEYNYYFLY